MRLFRGGRKPPFADRVASRFAFWIINDHPPPDQEAVRALERERRRHLQWLAAQAAMYLSFGGLLVVLAPQMALFVALLVLLLAAPTLWLLGRDWVATPALFDSAEAVDGLRDEVEKACQRSEAVGRYRQRLRRLQRPMLRIEAVAMVTVPDLDPSEWQE